jgi:hypothetical protein
VGGDKEKVDMLSTLSMVVGDITVGIVELIIGVMMHAKESPSG